MIVILILDNPKRLSGDVHTPARLVSAVEVGSGAHAKAAETNNAKNARFTRFFLLIGFLERSLLAGILLRSPS
jgi:hypothetical protein